MPSLIRKLLIGKPLPTYLSNQRRLNNLLALAVFASDALSSVSYATEEILLVLAVTGSHIQQLTIPISMLIVGLLFIVVFSYRQTIHAYPTGGGAYTVAKENLGTFWGLLAAGSLLVDYVLTVSVSVAAGIAAITSAAPALYDHRVGLAFCAVGIITVGNLRGVKESGKLFAAPVYGFMLAMGLLILGGLVNYITRTVTLVPDIPRAHLQPQVFQPLTWLLLLKAFASGCTALTGIEAVSNGVTAFEPPEAKNAGKVLRWMATILAVFFLGISGLAWLYDIMPYEQETVISQLARQIYGDSSVYLFIQIATCSILVLAANTSFADFPRLSSILARDGFVPRQLQSLGDRLVFSNGILLLAFFSCFMLWLFDAKTHRLIPLYAVGVFLSFTLSQAGMVIHHFKIKEPEWKKGLAYNLTGAVITLVVLMAILIAKFSHGAWIICIVLPMLVMWFYAVRDHYQVAQEQLAVDLRIPPRLHLKNIVIVPVGNIHRGVVKALEYARSISKTVHAVTVSYDEKGTEALSKRWKEWAPDISLVVLTSEYRSLTEPLLVYIRKIDAQNPGSLITVVIPSFVPARWWHNFLHNQSSLLLQAALRGMRNVVITSVRIHLDE